MGTQIRVPEQLDRSGEMRVAFNKKGTKQMCEHGQGKFVCLIDDALSQRTESFRNCGILHKHYRRRDLGADAFPRRTAKKRVSQVATRTTFSIQEKLKVLLLVLSCAVISSNHGAVVGEEEET